ncbi:hypothetical protein BC829DRAFT_178149 [Chytridium lagenaria]|nr:hypothetical protein BC829DRAFT_178149 [Chytridium lagenaria]
MFARAAMAGNASARNNLGGCYVLGIGVERDWEKALKWFERAAEQGNVSAKRNLEKLRVLMAKRGDGDDGKGIEEGDFEGTAVDQNVMGSTQDITTTKDGDDSLDIGNSDTLPDAPPSLGSLIEPTPAEVPLEAKVDSAADTIQQKPTPKPEESFSVEPILETISDSIDSLIGKPPEMQQAVAVSLMNEGISPIGLLGSDDSLGSKADSKAELLGSTETVATNSAGSLAGSLTALKDGDARSGPAPPTDATPSTEPLTEGSDSIFMSIVTRTTMDALQRAGENSGNNIRSRREDDAQKLQKMFMQWAMSKSLVWPCEPDVRTKDGIEHANGWHIIRRHLGRDGNRIEFSSEGRLVRLIFHRECPFKAVPNGFSKLTELRHLDLSSNKLKGQIPKHLGELVNLEVLNLGMNNLIGPIPKELGRLTSLRELALLYNRLTGCIPRSFRILNSFRTFGSTTIILSAPFLHLYSIFLPSANFTSPITKLGGAIPKEIGSLKELEALWANNNEFSGIIPEELFELAKLRKLCLHYNNLSGGLPAGVGMLTNLQELHLNNNLLYGPLPPTLSNLTNLEKLSLESNSLFGDIPPSLGDLAQLHFLRLDNNQLTGSIPQKSATSETCKNLKSIKTCWKDECPLRSLQSWVGWKNWI